MSFIFNPMKMGLTGLYMPRFDVDHWFDIVERDNPMMVFLVPAMAELITRQPALRRRRTSSSPIAVSIGSAPLAPATLSKLQDRMPQASVINSYGLTEAGPAFITMPKEEAAKRVGSVGKPMAAMEVKIVDPDTDDDPPPQTRSASCSCACRASGASTTRTTRPRTRPPGPTTAGSAPATSPTSMPTASSTSAGRIKDMIIRGGNNIYATDVEAVILEHPDVQEAAVVGVPHTVLGEDVGAFVVRKPGATLDEDRRSPRSAPSGSPTTSARGVLWFVRRAPPQRHRQSDEAQAAGTDRQGRRLTAIVAVKRRPSCQKRWMIASLPRGDAQHSPSC